MKPTLCQSIDESTVLLCGQKHDVFFTAISTNPTSNSANSLTPGKTLDGISANQKQTLSFRLSKTVVRNPEKPV